MHLKNKFNNTVNEIRTLEGQYANKVSAGSESSLDYHYMSYYSGLRNGINFVFHILDHDLSEQDYDAVEKKILNTDTKN